MKPITSLPLQWESRVNKNGNSLLVSMTLFCLCYCPSKCVSLQAWTPCFACLFQDGRRRAVWQGGREQTPERSYVQTVFLPDAPGCTGKKPTVLMTAYFLVGELLCELVRKCGSLGENLENRVCVCVLLVLFLAKTPPPLTQMRKLLLWSLSESSKKGS